MSARRRVGSGQPTRDWSGRGDEPQVGAPLGDGGRQDRGREVDHQHEAGDESSAGHEIAKPPEPTVFTSQP